MTMTLEQVRDWLVEVRKRNAVNATLDDLDDHDADAVIRAIDAHIAVVREVIESHINEAKKLRHDPETQDYLYEQADKLEAALPESKP